jgi:hypothetical protein
MDVHDRETFARVASRLSSQAEALMETQHRLSQEAKTLVGKRLVLTGKKWGKYEGRVAEIRTAHYGYWNGKSHISVLIKVRDKYDKRWLDPYSDRWRTYRTLRDLFDDGEFEEDVRDPIDRLSLLFTEDK